MGYHLPEIPTNPRCSDHPTKSGRAFFFWGSRGYFNFFAYKYCLNNLFYVSLSNHKEWVSVNGIFSTTEKKGKPRRVDINSRKNNYEKK